MTHKPYDPEAAVAEILNRFVSSSYETVKSECQLVIEADELELKTALRAALDAAYRAGKREAWGKAQSEALKGANGFEGCGCDDMIVIAARADGVDL